METPKKPKIESSADKKRKPQTSIHHDRTTTKDQQPSHHHHNHHIDKKIRHSTAADTKPDNMTSKPQVRASHILIKHKESRRKSSWKDPEGVIIKNTSKDSAITQLRSLRQDVLSGKFKFGEAASSYSHCNSAKRGGDLGSFGPGKMQKPFEEATFGLKVGEISDIVDTESGVHIILRTE